MSKHMTKSSGNVFQDLGFSAAESASLAIRSGMMIALREPIRHQDWTQERAAKIMRVTQPRISDLVRGRIDRFSVDSLIELFHACDMRVRFTVTKHSKRVA